MMESVLKFIARNDDYFLGGMCYFAFLIMLPDVELWRIVVGSLLITFAVSIAIFGWEYRDLD